MGPADAVLAEGVIPLGIHPVVTPPIRALLEHARIIVVVGPREPALGVWRWLVAFGPGRQVGADTIGGVAHAETEAGAASAIIGANLGRLDGERVHAGSVAAEPLQVVLVVVNGVQIGVRGVNRRRGRWRAAHECGRKAEAVV